MSGERDEPAPDERPTDERPTDERTIDGRSAEDRPPDERTRIKSADQARGGDSTQPGFTGNAALSGHTDDATRLQSAAPVDDRTRTQPLPPQPTSGGGRSATGSDWAHPEHWERRHEGPLAPGSVIKDRFVLESVLGQGGMGVVFRALDRRKQEARDRDPYIAVKILSEEFRRHPSALIALQREARKAQTLAHPNVITVHDFDRDGTSVYMTMELLEGEPLNRVIAGSKLRGLPAEKALPIVRGAAAALAYAHEKGIVHSDFKPGNVFLTRRNEVKVLDFGIARAVTTPLQAAGDRTVFDAAELGALTPGYASPEMIDGRDPEPADDVFALAIVAYELLTGRHPFDKTPANEARDDGMKPPILPLPRRQRRALARALSFDRDARHADARAFLKDLDGPSPLRKAAYAAVLVGMASVAAYGVYYGNQLRPDVPFAELPPEVREQFEQSIAEGQRALRFGAVGLNDAFEYFSSAYDLHRNNPRALEGLRLVADAFVRDAGEADPSTARDVVRKLYCHDYLSSYGPVTSLCADTLGGQCTPARIGCPTGEEGR